MIFLLSLMACNTEPSMKRINALDKRLNVAEKQLQYLQNEFDFLIDEYKDKESALRNNEYQMEIQLLRAYLQQFEDENVIMKDEVVYSRSQLKDLREDIEKGLYEQEQRDEYIDSEENAIEQIEAKIDYFIDRFKNQKDLLKDIEN